WNATTGETIRTLKGHANAVTSIAVMPDGRRVVSGSDDTTVKVWDLAVAQETRALKGSLNRAMTVAVMPDSKRILRGGNFTLKIEDPDTGSASPPGLRVSTGMNILSVAVMPDGKRIVSADRTDAVRVWDADTGQEIRSVKGHRSRLTSVAVSPDG